MDATLKRTNGVNLIIQSGGVMTDAVSDGFHTFGELYRHRAALFSVICNVFKEKAWKSRLHSDGTMFDRQAH